MMNLIDVEDLHIRYGAYEAVKGVSFTLGAGEILGIVGESGSGKSTIAKTLMGLEKPSSGRITNRATATQMIFQDAVGSLNPRMTIRQTLTEVLNHQDRKRTITDHDVEQLLTMVGLSRAVMDQYPREMSGGQCQRVSIARALACRPQVLVADEPVSALDVSVQARVLNLLRELRQKMGLSILLIAHDLAVVKNVCDHICVMEHGRFVDQGPAGEVFSNPKSDYTRRLLAAVPRLVPRLACLAWGCAILAFAGCEAFERETATTGRTHLDETAAAKHTTPHPVAVAGKRMTFKDTLRLAPDDIIPQPLNPPYRVEATFSCDVARPEDATLAGFADATLLAAYHHARGEERAGVSATGVAGVREAFYNDYREWFAEEGASLTNGDMTAHVGCWTCHVAGKVAFCDERHFSYRVIIDTYCGGAHPNRWVQNATYDRQTGRRLTVADIIPQARLTDVLNRIRRALRTEARRDATLSAQLKGDIRIPYEQYVSEIRTRKREEWGNPLVTENFMLTKDGITWTYNQYEIACYAAGWFDARIRWKKEEGRRNIASH